MKNSFEVAIKVLQEADKDAFYDDYGPAIRVLEAAGRVDRKKDLEEFQRFMCRWGGMISSEQESYERIRALLESLPDKEKE